MTKIRQKPILYQILFRITLLFFIFLLLVFAMYVNGNFRGFQEHTQLFLLFIMSLVSSLVLVFSSIVFALTIYFSIRFRSFLFIFNTLFIILSFICSLGFLYFSQAIHLLAFGF